MSPRLPATTLLLALLSGCASVNFDQSLARTNDTAASFTQGQLALAQTREQRAAQDEAATAILQQPLAQADAVRLALVNSPALQALLAQHWADAASAAQGGRIANPFFSFASLRSPGQLALERMLSFGLLDLLTLPQRQGIAQRQLAAAQLRLTRDVVAQVTQVRQAWVKAVAAQQSLVYAQQVNDAAEASAELARRMQAAGNFSRLQRARQQAFYADAATQWAHAQQAATATREELVRQLGLTDAQASALQLPDRLPDLPQAPRTPDDVGQAARATRLDIQLAQAEYESSARTQGLNVVTSFTDIQLGVRRNTQFDSSRPPGSQQIAPRGYEVDVVLPLFDWGDLKRDAMNARTLAAAQRLEAATRAAGSSLRESYAAYRTAYDVSRHHRDEVVPLRKTIAQENALRYNGMLISVFELLADARDQVASVLAAIAAEQQFWLSDAALQAAVIGQPALAPASSQTSSQTFIGTAP